MILGVILNVLMFMIMGAVWHATDHWHEFWVHSVHDLAATVKLWNNLSFDFLTLFSHGIEVVDVHTVDCGYIWDLSTFISGSSGVVG